MSCRKNSLGHRVTRCRKKNALRASPEAFRFPARAALLDTLPRSNPVARGLRRAQKGRLHFD
jgi:hypothetical protein